MSTTLSLALQMLLTARDSLELGYATPDLTRRVLGALMEELSEAALPPLRWKEEGGAENALIQFLWRNREHNFRAAWKMLEAPFREASESKATAIALLTGIGTSTDELYRIAVAEPKVAVFRVLNALLDSAAKAAEGKNA